MKIVEQSWEWLRKPEKPLQLIELAARSCYKSEDKITDKSADKFVRMLRDRKHETPIEHATASIKIITNRGVMAELTRHRICSFSVTSTRYVRYDGQMEFIKPVWWDNWSEAERAEWNIAMQAAEKSYLTMLSHGSRPEQAREVLNNALKTEIVMTTNLREWRLVLSLRCSKQAHPQIRGLMRSILIGMHEEVPVLFDDLHDKYIDNT